MCQLMVTDGVLFRARIYFNEDFLLGSDLKFVYIHDYIGHLFPPNPFSFSRLNLIDRSGANNFL